LPIEYLAVEFGWEAKAPVLAGLVRLVQSFPLIAERPRLDA
jgi:hypothetical protein